MTWEQAPETDPEDTWKGSMGTTCRVVVQKARVGWDWIAQWRIGSREWHDEYAAHDATALAELIRTGRVTADEVLDAAIAAHIATGQHTLAWAVEIVRPDTTVFRFCSASRAATISGDAIQGSVNAGAHQPPPQLARSE